MAVVCGRIIKRNAVFILMPAKGICSKKRIFKNAYSLVLEMWEKSFFKFLQDISLYLLMALPMGSRMASRKVVTKSCI
jgi:hypothetical protein